MDMDFHTDMTYFHIPEVGAVVQSATTMSMPVMRLSLYGPMSITERFPSFSWIVLTLKSKNVVIKMRRSCFISANIYDHVVSQR